MEHAAAAESGAYKSTLQEVISEALVLILAALLIYFFAQNTPVMSVLIGILIVLRFVLLNRRGDWMFFLVGFVVGGGNDALSMFKGVYYYTPERLIMPDNIPIPAWMLVFWGLAFLFFRKLFRYNGFMGEDRKPDHIIDLPLAVDICIAVIFRKIVYTWASDPWLPAALYSSILALRWILIPPKDYERKVIIAILLLGPFYEAALIKAGLYVYQHGYVLGMPLWLVVYWAFIIRVLKAVFDRLEYGPAMPEIEATQTSK